MRRTWSVCQQAAHSQRLSMGPLWGRQNRRYGYDMRPDKRLTRAQLRHFFTPWHYPSIRMAWEGDWVSVQPRG